MKDDKKKLVLVGVVALLALVAAVVMGGRSMGGPPQTIANTSQHLGDKGYDNAARKGGTEGKGD